MPTRCASSPLSRDAERHVDGRGHLLLVLDLGFGERRAAVEAPVHGLHALVEVAVGDDAAEGAQLLRLVLRRHGEVGMVPVTQHAEALEVGALQIDLLVRKGAAGGAEGAGVQLVARPAVLFLDLQLDRQAVAVPARHVGRIEAVERARLDDDVLEDLVDRMPDMDHAVGIRRTVVQHEARPSAREFAQLRVRCRAPASAAPPRARGARGPPSWGSRSAAG